MAVMTAISKSPRGAVRSIARTLVIPVYRNEENIPSLLEALEQLDRSLNGLEVVCVVDGSPDRSGELLATASQRTSLPLRVVFHSRNFGSFTAIRTGLEFASGANVAVMAADLQEPPELVVEFFSVLERGEADVVFGERTGRHDALIRDALSNAFWWLYRKSVIRDVPRGGVDIFACSRAAADAVLRIEEPNSSLIAQLFWIGFRRKFVAYSRRERQHGKSAWSLSRRLRYMLDSIVSFTDLPIMFVLWVGLAGCIISLVAGTAIGLLRIVGEIQVPGYAAIAVLITFSTSAMLAVQGILGLYLWRTFENTKRRPLRLVARVVESKAAASAASATDQGRLPSSA
jgi:glycosyltransferase involved in cell wall biosynthesis